MLKTIRIACLGALLSWPVLAWANWGEYKIGTDSTGNLKAYGTEQVELLDEDLQVEFQQGFAVVAVRYVFRNTGSAVEVKAGFPSRIYEDGKREVEAYEIKVSGKAAAFEREPSREPHYDDQTEDEYAPIKVDWLVSKVPFRANEQKEVSISYRAPYFVAMSGVSDNEECEAPVFKYLLSTGSTWKGPIRKGKVTFRSIAFDPAGISISPKGRFKQDGSAFFWEFKNLEPTEMDDMTVTLGTPTAILHHYGIFEELQYHRIGKSHYYLVHTPSGASASSTLKGKAGPYQASNVSDGKLATAWAPGKPDGVGESLTLKFDKPAPVNQFAIYPGYGKSWSLYHANNRVAKMELSVNGKHKQVFTFKDIPGKTQLVDIKGYSKRVSFATFTILEVYKGDKYADTPISEIEARQSFPKEPKIHGPR